MSVNPFWEFSLEVYEREGVADACIALQDEAALDVNVLLFCVWCGASGPGALGAEDVRAALAATATWQSEVVRPVRTARRAARKLGGAGLFTSAFRRDVAATELSAERVEQWLLYDLVAERACNEREPQDGLAAACANITLYLRASGVDAAASRPRLATLLAACWTELDSRQLEAAAASIRA